MLITLCYVYMWVRFHKCYSVLIRNSLFRLKNSRSSFCFSFCSGSASAPPTGLPPSPPVPEDNVFLQLGDKAVYVTELQVCGDLSKWTALLGSSLVCGPRIENVSFIIEAAGHAVGYTSPPATNKKVLKWSDYCFPLACSSEQPFKFVAQASVENFSHLAVAFIEDRLQLDDGLVPSKIIPVLLQEHTLSKLLENQSQQNPKTAKTSSCTLTTKVVSESFHHFLLSEQQHGQWRKGSLLLLPGVKRRVEERRGSEPLPGTQDFGSVCNLGDHILNHQHMEGHGHHLHLSSCHECLELENSTILSVKNASTENIPDLPDDNFAELDSMDGCVVELEYDPKEGCGQGTDCTHKLPNVLVYTGGCQQRFQVVHQLLTECINDETNVIYPLLPQQALTDPWLDNTRLLVLAEEEPLTPELQTRFLTYLSEGGKVLGLGSTLCPAGLNLEIRERQQLQVRRLLFTREDSTELKLSIIACENVYIRDPQGGGEVELWGELQSDLPQQRDMVIVRVTHGADGGEAVLCQVRFDIGPGSHGLDSEDCEELKVSSSLRHEILTEIITSLGLSCEPNQTPVLSPVHLLATTSEARNIFLKWLQTCADCENVLRFSKASFKMVSSSELCDDALPGGCLALITESQEFAHFDMEIYSKSLQTSHLGHTLLYAEIVTSTMDLLEGLVLKLPNDVGLIAISARQTKGRGRGRNSWLSPPGCAMFTVSIQVKLSSRLGQRIPFLQHLSALAIVEAVRTLPGYQDIDLRVKWPNDIYYSNLTKLGGVLVTSTVMGQTFHLLIGCGVNVTNSNPTLCINDLIQQYNTQNNCSLEPLSCSQLIALSLNCLEDLISCFQQGGPGAVLPIYYNRWLHTGTKVRLWSEEGPEAQVVGLDDNGFLQVYSKEQGLVSVEPDGNSFDMLKNLVVIKQR